MALEPDYRGRFNLFREHVEYWPISESQMGEHVWARTLLGNVDADAARKIKERQRK